jgi:hypothetical protein
MNSGINPLFDPATDDQPIQENVQEEIINEPKNDPKGITEDDHEFLIKVMEMVDREEINLHQPNTLIKHDVYDELDDEKKGKADLNALNLLATLRQIKSLWDLDKKESFQINNLVHQVHETKKRVEAECGDVYVI